MSAETAARLRTARQLLVDKGWTKGQMARNRDNEPEFPESRHARCYCAIGALWAAVPSGQRLEPLGALLAALPEGYGDIGRYNDQTARTLADILALYDRAIAAEEQQP